MACAAYQPISGQLLTSWNRENSDEYAPTTTRNPAVLSRITGFYSRVQQRLAARLLAGSLFEPTRLDTDQRDHVEQLAGVLDNLRRETEKQRAYLRGGGR
jgi:hypothetical protein